MLSIDKNQKWSAGWRSQLHRIIRGVFLSIFVNPFALVVACVTIWILSHLIHGITTAVAEGEHWTIESLIGCGSSITALVLIALLATSHFVVTVVFGAYRTRY